MAHRRRDVIAVRILDRRQTASPDRKTRHHFGAGFFVSQTIISRERTSKIWNMSQKIISRERYGKLMDLLTAEPVDN